MENSKKRLPDSLPARVERTLGNEIFPGARLTVGLSGGVDSVVLLYLLRGLSKSRGFSLSAIHVDHRISPHSGKWSEFCARLCREWQIPLQVRQVDVGQFAVHGPEGGARAARYAEFAKLDTDFLVLAQHRDDQCETLLLQLLRGAGLLGLSAMPKSRQFAAMRLLRPLLAVSRSEIVNFALENHLSWVDDDSNLDSSFSRNHLRLEVLPLVEKSFPGYRQALTRAASHFAEAQALLDEMAALDAAASIEGKMLDLDCLRRLSIPRAKNLLRHFLSMHELRMPSSARLDEMLREFRTPTGFASIRHEAHELRAFQGKLHLLPLQTHIEPYCLEWQGEERLVLPSGEIVFERVQGGGISESQLQQVSIRSIAGGERIRLDAARPRRTLKNLYRERAIAPWERNGAPLLFCGEKLVWAQSIGVDCAFAATDGQNGIVPCWRPIFCDSSGKSC